MHKFYDFTRAGLTALVSDYPECADRAAMLIAAAESSSDVPGPIEVSISFPGFYGSELSDAIERTWDDETYAHDADYSDGETSRGFCESYFRARAAGVLHDEIIEKARESVEWPHVRDAAARAYVDIYVDAIGDALADWLFNGAAPFGLVIPVFMGFSRIDSPREYNFFNDDCICIIEREPLAMLYELALHKGFEEYFGECLKPRSGFIPFSCAFLLGDRPPFTMKLAASEKLFGFLMPYEQIVSPFEADIGALSYVSGYADVFNDAISSAVIDDFDLAIERAAFSLSLGV